MPLSTQRTLPGVFVGNRQIIEDSPSLFYRFYAYTKVFRPPFSAFGRIKSTFCQNSLFFPGSRFIFAVTLARQPASNGNNQPTMKLKYTISLFLTILAFTCAFLVLQSSAPASKNSPCKETLDECSNKKKSADKMIFENLSQQFFSSI
jgi:hypothetical protein